eukprot:superscaffoldBa00000050_g858
MQGSVCCEGETSEAFPICSRVKHGCVLAPTLFGIIFSLLLSFAFGSSPGGVYLHTRADSKLFNLARLWPKTKVTIVFLNEMLFAHNAALAFHTESGLQGLMDRLSHACKDFAFTISIKKTNITCQKVEPPPSISIDNKTLDCFNTFTYLGAEMSTHLAGAAAVMSKLSKKVWSNKNLPVRKKPQKKVPNIEVLEHVHSTSMFTMLSQRHLRWLGHVHRMDPSWLSRAILYGKLSTDYRPGVHPCLCFKDSCKHNMKQAGIDPNSWEEAANDHSVWRQTAAAGTRCTEERCTCLLQEKRQKRKL